MGSGRIKNESLNPYKKVVLSVKPIDELLITEMKQMLGFDRNQVVLFCFDMVAEIIKRSQECGGIYIYSPPSSRKIGAQVLAFLGVVREGSTEWDKDHHDRIAYPFEPLPELMDAARAKAELSGDGEASEEEFWLTENVIRKWNKLLRDNNISSEDAASLPIAAGFQYLAINAAGKQWGYKAREKATLATSQYDHHDTRRDVKLPSFSA